MRPGITTSFAVLAGFLGGALSHYLFTPAVAHAQTPASEIRAQKFVLVDENGAVRGVFGFKTDGSPELQIRLGKGSGSVYSPRWYGLFLQRNALPDLKASPPNGSGQPTQTE